ncbi:LPS-assembly protein [Desulfobaculum xiamenense]|uniref:LPS-assembly protein n=1 Tax=Desulfobaculum xiamenense TaxID=995050 RepID=A0A846QLG4_9BACT|nr:LPS assembly protein LptD [Desulfobaculum xiamenense]NJB67023.1 LPS-assembly protein [Desulfobaculum xiamenense]
MTAMIRTPLHRTTGLVPALLAVIATALFFAAARPALAGGDILSDHLAASATQDAEAWQLSADSMAAEHDPEIIEASGNVVLSQGKRTLRADFARYYRKTGWVYLKGNVEAMWTKDRLTADEAEFDLKSRVGWLKNGYVFIDDAHLYFSGRHIEKHEGDTYTFRSATVTSCDDPSEAWSIDMDEGEVTIEGYAWLKRTAFKVGDTSLLATPFMVLPAKVKRQSGLLIPEIGVSSRNGFYINQPIYWAIDEERDATFYENFLANRGLRQGIEYRNTPDSDSKSVWQADWLHDSIRANSESDEDSQFDDDGLIRPNRNRYWFRSKFNGHLPDPQWKVKLDIDYASDQNYLREFKSGLSGFDRAKDLFLDEFGRDIADADSLERTTTLLVSRSWDRFGVAGRMQYTQNLSYMNDNLDPDDNPTLQRLPELSAYVWKDRIVPDLPVEFMMDSTVGYNWRAKGDSGGRVEVDPTVSVPFFLGPVSVIPSAGMHETLYIEDDFENENTDAETGRMRHLPSVNVATFTEFSRVFDLDTAALPATAENAGESRWQRIRHAIQPRVDFDWTPYVGQTENPYFDETDRLDARNEITYSLTNVLDRRRVTITPRGEGDDTTYAPVVDYLDFLRLRLEQSYDRREATREDELDTYERRPFSDFLAEAVLRYNNYVSWTSRTLVSPYLGDMTEHEHFVTLELPETLRVNFGVDFQEALDEYKRQDRERIRQLKLGVDWAINRHWALGMLYRTDIENATDLEKTLRLMYTHQCYGFEVLLTTTDDEARVEARVSLLGLTM